MTNWDTSSYGFVFWKTKIAAALKLWRLGFHQVLNDLQECQKAQPELYREMVGVPNDELDCWPNKA